MLSTNKGSGHFTSAKSWFFFYEHGRCTALALRRGNENRVEIQTNQPELKTKEQRENLILKKQAKRLRAAGQTDSEKQKALLGRNRAKHTAAETGALLQGSLNWPLNRQLNLESSEVVYMSISSLAENATWYSFFFCAESKIRLFLFLPPTVKKHSGCSSEIANICSSCIRIQPVNRSLLQRASRGSSLQMKPTP
jgi:hypothetical protein